MAEEAPDQSGADAGRKKWEVFDYKPLDEVTDEELPPETKEKWWLNIPTAPDPATAPPEEASYQERKEAHDNWVKTQYPKSVLVALTWPNITNNNGGMATYLHFTDSISLLAWIENVGKYYLSLCLLLLQQSYHVHDEILTKIQIGVQFFDCNNLIMYMMRF